MQHGEIVGRDAELADLERTVIETGRGLILRGERGVGKTALVEALLASVRDHMVVQEVSATDASQSIPFGALAPLLGQVGAAPMATVQIISMAKDALRRRPSGRPMVLSIDDAHLLDDASATLLDQVARDEEVLVVATHPSTEPVPIWLQQLIQTDHMRSYRVEPLDRDRTSKLIRSILEGDIAEELDAELWRLSRGNPLVVRQLIAAALNSSTLSRSDDCWRADQGFVAIGEATEIFDLRLAELDSDQSTILDVATIGGVVELALLNEVGSLALVEELEAAELIRVTVAGNRVMCQLRHPLLAERIGQSMPVTRRRRIGLTMADWLAATGARRHGDTLRVATWDLAAGITTRTGMALEAASQAVVGIDLELAERLCRSVLADHDDFSAELTLSRALIQQGKHAESIEADIRAERLARTDDQIVRLTMARCERLTAGGGLNLREAADLANSVAGRLSDGAALDVLNTQMARLAMASGDAAEAVRITAQLAARNNTSPRARLVGLVVSASAKVALGRFDEVFKEVEDGYLLLENTPASWLFERDRLLISEADAMLYSGRFVEALTVMDRSLDDALDADHTVIVGVWRGLRGHTLGMIGDIHEARNELDRCVAAMSKFDPLGILPRFQAWRILAAAQAGRTHDAESILAAIDSDVAETSFRSKIAVAQARAWVTAMRGDSTGAAAQSGEAGLMAISGQYFAFAAPALHDAVRFGHPELVVDALVEVAERCTSALITTYADHARALVDGDGAFLDRVSETFGSMGAHLLAAEASIQASNEHQRASDRAAERRSRARAEFLLRECRGVGSFLVVGRSPVLTKRQDQIARMAVHYPNAEIAARLHISVRTVENHLQIAYDLLGVHSRAELMGVMMAPGLARRPGPSAN